MTNNQPAQPAKEKSMSVGTGTWRAKAISAWLTKSEKKGTEGVSIEFEAVDGTFAGERIVWTGWLTDKTIDRSIESLRHCGWKGDDLSDLSTVRGECEIVVEEEEYEKKNGEPGLAYRVRWVNALGGRRAGGAPLEVSDAKSLAQRMKARIQASDRARAERAAAEGAEGNPL